MKSYYATSEAINTISSATTTTTASCSSSQTSTCSFAGTTKLTNQGLASYNPLNPLAVRLDFVAPSTTGSYVCVFHNEAEYTRSLLAGLGISVMAAFLF